METIYYLGIDLGTSRTSVATSTGKRETLITCVGYAKDLIAKKRLGKDYLIGQEALDNRLSLNIIWPLGPGVIEDDPKAIEAVNLVLKHIIAKVLPDKKPEDKIYASIGVPAEANNKSKKDVLKSTKEIIDKVMIISEPFAVAYSMDRLDESMIVDIGAGSVDLLRVCGTFPTAEDSITLETAGNYLDKIIEQKILKEYPRVQLTKGIIKSMKEKHGYVTENVDKILVILTEKGKPIERDLTNVIRESCLELTNPICKAVQELVASFDPEFQEKLRNNIIVAGGGSRLKGIDRAIEKGLSEYGGGSVTCVQDAEFQGCIGCLTMAAEIPEEYWDEI